MKSLQFIIQFGWPYLKRYKTRLFLGIAFGFLYAIPNALLPPAVMTMTERLSEEETSVAVIPQTPSLSTSSDYPDWAPAMVVQMGNQIQKKSVEWKEAFFQTIDPWLPKRGRELDWKQMMGCLIFLPLLFGARGILGYINGYCMKWVNEKVINDLRYNVLVKLNTLSMDYYHKAKTGDLITRITGDTKNLYYAWNLGFSDLSREPATVVGILLGLFWIDWQLTLFVFIFLPFTVLPISILAQKVRKAGQGSVRADILQSNNLLETIANMRIVKAFALQGFQEERFLKYARKRFDFNMKSNRAQQLVNPIIETGSALVVGGLLLFVFATEREVPALAAFIVAVGLLYTSVKRLAKVTVLFQKARYGIERMQETFSEEPTVRDPGNPVNFSEFKKEIQLKKVSFSYGELPVLNRVSLTIEKGKKIGIAGESGSGKSSLLNIIYRFYDPTDGSVEIDGIDIRQIETKTLCSCMALVSQDVFLFDGTIAENIAMGRLGATQEEIEEAAKKAYAHDFIMQSPDKYETRIGERGMMLSGGQKQRLSIARAFVRNAPILILDEATAALDSQSEKEVQKALDDLALNRTTISVAHRLSTLKNCDEIIVLQEGQIVEEGTFEELLEKEGVFAAMAKTQSLSQS